MWVTKLMISQVKKRIFAQKRPNLAQNWQFWSIWARPCRLIQCPVGDRGTRAVSRKTPIYFIILSNCFSDNMFHDITIFDTSSVSLFFAKPSIFPRLAP